MELSRWPYLRPVSHRGPPSIRKYSSKTSTSATTVASTTMATRSWILTGQPAPSLIIRIQTKTTRNGWITWAWPRWSEINHNCHKSRDWRLPELLQQSIDGVAGDSNRGKKPLISSHNKLTVQSYCMLLLLLQNGSEPC